MVGDNRGIELPDFKRVRVASGRFRGLRLVHTHLRGEPLTQDDLTDLALLRLDLVAAIGVERGGRPGLVHMATLRPQRDGERGEPWQLLKAEPAHGISVDFEALIRSLEGEFARTTDRVAPTDLGKDRALLVHVSLGRQKESLRGARVFELQELA